MILRLSYEEIQALRAAIEQILAVPAGAPPRLEASARVVAYAEKLLPRLDGDLSLEHLDDAEQLDRTVDHMLDELRAHVDDSILSQHVGAEDTIHAFFDYGHVLTVSDRLRALREEMKAMVELITGEPPSAASARDITFPD